MMQMVPPRLSSSRPSSAVWLLLLCAVGTTACRESKCSAGEYSFRFGLGDGGENISGYPIGYPMEPEVNDAGELGMTVGWRSSGIDVEGYFAKYLIYDFDAGSIIKYTEVHDETPPTCDLSFSGAWVYHSAPVWVPLNDAEGLVEFVLLWYGEGDVVPNGRGFVLDLQVP